MNKTALEAAPDLVYANLREANVARQAAWCPEQIPDLSFRGNELAGETGEVCNVVKKLERERLGWRGSRDTVAHLAEELADVVICADLVALSAGIDLDAAVEAKFNATSEKVGLPHRLRRSPAPAPAEGVTVRPLEWRTEQTGSMHSAELYYIERSDDGFYLYFIDTPLAGPVTLPAAKAAAQEDYASRIRSALLPSESAEKAGVVGWGANDLAELRRMVPDLDAVITHNPINQVYFRAGLLACREYMARFVEQGGAAVTAASIRANWWPLLGDDPGAPRQLAFEEVAVEKDNGGYATSPALTPSIEALPKAFAFLAAPASPSPATGEA